MEKDDFPDTQAARNLMVAFLLSISYASSVGGNGTLVGGTPNLILKGYFDSRYKDGGLNFITYLAFALPLTILMVAFMWIVICLMWLPTSEFRCCKKGAKKCPLKDIMVKQYTDLGPYT
jgi:di/tricarboxylate transporter